MKKFYTSTKYKKRQKSKLSRIQKRISTKKKREQALRNRKRKSEEILKKQIYNGPKQIIAPVDFRTMENTEQCLSFFREIRNLGNAFFFRNSKIISISLKSVEQIDYATISILTSISDDLRDKRIILNGDFPESQDCKEFIIQSGFLNRMVDGNNKKFPVQAKSDVFYFEKGTGKLSLEDRKKISLLVKEVVYYLTNTEKNIKPIKSVLLEICANAIEHSGTRNKQWLLGIMYEKEKVIFTVSDVGRGILETLYIKFKKKIAYFFTKSRDEILMQAFYEKYNEPTNSSTKENNRNKGLPSIKTNFDNGTIKNLIVLTNNVILHFSDKRKCKVLKKGAARLKGTLFQWELTQECITNTINVNNENN